MTPSNKEEFIDRIYELIEEKNVDVIDAVIEVSAEYDIDMETAGKIIKSSSGMLELLTIQARREHLLVSEKAQ